MRVSLCILRKDSTPRSAKRALDNLFKQLSGSSWFDCELSGNDVGDLFAHHFISRALPMETVACRLAGPLIHHQGVEIIYGDTGFRHDPCRAAVALDDSRVIDGRSFLSSRGVAGFF